MSRGLLKPLRSAMIYEDDRLYACLATYPFTRGHVIVAWKKAVPDLGRLNEREYDYLMDVVNDVRSAMLKALKIRKVYLVYMDEVQHVHWHLVPRYNEQGFNIFAHQPKKLTDFALVAHIQRRLRAQPTK